MISFTLIYTIIIIIVLLVLITNNKKLTKFFNFEDITNKNIKYKVIFYFSMFLLLKIKKIFYIILIIYLIFNIINIYKIKTTYKIVKIKPLIKNKNNPLYLISLLSFLSIYYLLSNKNNKKIIFKAIIKIIPNILLSISILLYKLNIFITNIIYEKKSFFEIKKNIYEIIHIYYKILYKSNFYGMKSIDKKLLFNIKECNISNSNNITMVMLKSKNSKGDDVLHPAVSWYTDNLTYVNTITHKPISIKTEPLKINTGKNIDSYSESVFTNKKNLYLINKNYEVKLYDNLNINTIENFNEYKKNMLEYNDYIFKLNKEVIDQTSDNKYILADKIIEISNLENINKILTIDLITQKKYEEILFKDKNLYNYYINLKNSEKISFLLNIKDETF